jgi:predicted ester cyclase
LPPICGVVASFAEPRYDVPAMGDLGQAKGGQAVHDLIGMLFVGFPDWHAEPGPLHHAADAVFTEVRMTGTHQGEFAGIPPTGQKMDVRVGCIFDFEGDRLVCERVYFDFATVLRQLGVAN